MRRQVFPHPPSPTTTIFFEYEGPSVMCVAAESRPVDAELMVPTVPSLDLALSCLSLRVGFLRLESYCSDIEEDCLLWPYPLD